MGDAKFFMLLEIEGARDTVENLVRFGREVEWRVLARAVRRHLEEGIVVDGVNTVVFE